MNEFLDFISLSLPTMIISVINLLILYLILKKFLFAPVQKIISQREQEVDSIYKKAKEELFTGESMSASYKEKLDNIEEERNKLISAAVADADKRCEKMIANTQKDIVRLKKESEKEISISKEKAYKEAKEEIADISVAIAGQILKREIDANKHADIVEEFVDSLEVVR